MKTSNQLLLLGVLSTLSAGAAAADGPAPARVDTSQWKCEACKFEQGASGTLDVGIGTVSDKSAEFGQYNGLHDKGGYFIGDAAVRSRGEDGTYWNLDATNLGLDTRAIDVEGGKQGSYKLRLKYDETPHRIYDGALTPFVGSGGASLTLPAGFPAATTAAMPLGNTVDLWTQRKQTGVGASWTPVRDWEYAANYRHETREGNMRTAGAFFTTAAQLVEPVDTVTDQVDASVSYTGGKLQAKLAYYGSSFRNSNDALNWQNPFTPVVAGATSGQLALAPDNQFHQVLASAGYQFSQRTRASADIAFGRMTQNDGFLAPTQNATLVVPGMPGSSLNGRVATMDANLKLTSAVTDRLRLNAAYVYSDRDNQTSQAAYPWVSTDLFAAAPRTNLPYSFTFDKIKLGADYKFTAATKVFAGVDRDTRKRSFQESDKTTEDTAWVRVTTRVVDKVDVALRYAHGERENSGYQPVPGITPAENPLLRKYNMANRTRDNVGLRVDIAAEERVTFGFGVESSDDAYSESSIGLLSGKDFNLNGDITVAFTPDTRLFFFASHQELTSKQAGSQAYAAADWTGDNNDKIDVFGLGIKHAAIKDKLDIGADLSTTRSKGNISVSTGASNPAFPELSTRLNSFKLYANYRLKDNLSLLASYWYERYDTKNWMYDGVGPATIPNVLTLGEESPRYNVSVVRMALRYKF